MHERQYIAAKAMINAMVCTHYDISFDDKTFAIEENEGNGGNRLRAKEQPRTKPLVSFTTRTDRLTGGFGMGETGKFRAKRRSVSSRRELLLLLVRRLCRRELLRLPELLLLLLLRIQEQREQPHWREQPPVQTNP